MEEEYHIHMSIEGLDSAEEFAVVSESDEDLGVGFDSFGKQGEGSAFESLLLNGALLRFSHLI